MVSSVVILISGLSLLAAVAYYYLILHKPKDEIVSDWSDWDECDKTCGYGKQRRTRTILQQAADGGDAYPYDLVETRVCKDKDCVLTGSITFYTKENYEGESITIPITHVPVQQKIYDASKGFWYFKSYKFAAPSLALFPNFRMVLSFGDKCFVSTVMGILLYPPYNPNMLMNYDGTASVANFSYPLSIALTEKSDGYVSFTVDGTLPSTCKWSYHNGN